MLNDFDYFSIYTEIYKYPEDYDGLVFGLKELTMCNILFVRKN